MRSDPGEHWSGGSLVDVAEQRVAPIPAVSPEPPPKVLADTEMTTLRRRRRIVVAAVIGLAGLVLTDVVVGKIMLDQRQRHLAAELAEPVERLRVGDAAMVLQIPSIGLNRVVIEGSSASQLRSGPGRLETSAQPTDDSGATVILGRRSRYGGPFRLLDDVEKGDLVAVRTRSQEVRRYTVTDIGRTDAPVSPSSTTRLVLVTSAGGRFDRRYLVIEAAPEGASDASDPGTTPPRPAKSAERLDRAQLDRRPSAVAGLVSFVVMGLLAGSSLIFWRWSGARYGRGVRLVGVGLLGAAGAVTLMTLADLVLPATG